MQNENHDWIEKSAPFFFIFISISVAIVIIVVNSQRQLSQLEGTLFQVFSLGAGLIGSYLFGRRSAKSAAKEIIKPHARSSFRRVVRLYSSLSRLASEIEQSKQNDIKAQNYHFVLDKIAAIVFEQISTAGDAIEDWRDIVPEDVNKLEEKLKAEELKSIRRSNAKE